MAYFNCSAGKVVGAEIGLPLLEVSGSALVIARDGASARKKMEKAYPGLVVQVSKLATPNVFIVNDKGYT